jgi:hypothetical protein
MVGIGVECHRPGENLRLPYMWASRKPIKIMPVTAIRALRATVDLLAC